MIRQYLKDLTTLEILGVAIQSEIESARYYQRLMKAVKNPVLKDKLKFLASEEQKHRIMLTEYYRKRFAGTKLSSPLATLVPKPVIPKGRVTVSLLLKIAMKAEENAESFYLAIARTIKDTPGDLLLKYLAKVENSHYYLLKNELELMEEASHLKTMRLIYQSDEAVHIGP